MCVRQKDRLNYYDMFQNIAVACGFLRMLRTVNLFKAFLNTIFKHSPGGAMLRGFLTCQYAVLRAPAGYSKAQSKVSPSVLRERTKFETLVL